MDEKKWEHKVEKERKFLIERTGNLLKTFEEIKGSRYTLDVPLVAGLFFGQIMHSLLDLVLEQPDREVESGRMVRLGDINKRQNKQDGTNRPVRKSIKQSSIELIARRLAGGLQRCQDSES